MTSAGLNMHSVKSKNRSLVLYLLNKHKALSRKDIASMLSLTPAAVTKICQSLIDEGSIYESGTVLENGKTGRREILLSLNLDDKLVVGVNAEQDAITFSLSAMSGKLIDSKKIDFCKDVSVVSNMAYDFVSTIDCDKSNIVAVGVCVIGSPYDDDFGVWKGEDVVYAFKNKFHLPVVVENNVKAYAESSLIFDDINDDSALFLKWGPGIGSSIIANGKVFSGNDSGVAEIGHYIVDSGGKACRCGRFGCLETVASCDAIVNEIGKNLTLDKIICSGDNDIVNVIDYKIDLVALALTNTATILNTKSIVLFGPMFKNQLVVDKLIKQCIRYNSNLSQDMIRLSDLNEKGDYIGACAICAKYCFFEREA